MSVAGEVSKFLKGEWLGSRKISKIFIVTTHQLLGKFSQNLHQKPRCEQEAKNFEESASPTNTSNNDTLIPPEHGHHCQDPHPQIFSPE